MIKDNYDKKMQEIIAENQKNSRIPTLLLHTCCAPCSSSVITRLQNYFKITVLYYNPNIEPLEEYEKRKEEQIRFLKEFPCQNEISFLDSDYEGEAFQQISKGLEMEPEGGARCVKCYWLRLAKTAEIAKVNHFKYFGTSLTVSPYKNAKVLNEIGEQLAKTYHINFLYSDFKKNDGYKKSIELSKTYHLYRQDYCGCQFSKREREKNIQEKSSPF